MTSLGSSVVLAQSVSLFVDDGQRSFFTEDKFVAHSGVVQNAQMQKTTCLK